MKNTRHIPVLLHEVVNGLQITSGDTVVDATFGGGGHSQALLEAVGETGKVIALDRDQSAIARFQKENVVPENLFLVHANYSALRSVLDAQGIQQVDAILADLGFSSDQIEDDARGMSFLSEGPLDMRMDQTEEETAERILNQTGVSDLARIFRTHGDEPAALKIAKAIARARTEKPISTTGELVAIIEKISPIREQGKKGSHPATKIFQALRIAVNQEREHLARFLESTVDTLKPEGRLAVISFHSGEDRAVKQFLAESAKDCVCPRVFPVCRCDKKATFKKLTQKGVRASEDEVAKNPRARSAVLRLAEKIGG